MKNDMFDNVSFDMTKFYSDMQKMPAHKDYAVFFTPRSGSSWLTDVIVRAGNLGNPDEWFNPALVPKSAEWLNAASVADLINMLRRKQSPGNIFGFELTYYHMISTFGSKEAYLAHFPVETICFFLIRENITLQAVSLAKSVETSLFHSTDANADRLRVADESFQYDPERIRYWLTHILNQEVLCEDFFARYGIAPVRLSYEMLMALGVDETRGKFARELGRDLGTDGHYEEKFRKIGTDKNKTYASRFIEENPAFLATVAEQRQGTLRLLRQAHAPHPALHTAGLVSRILSPRHANR